MEDHQSPWNMACQERGPDGARPGTTASQERGPDRTCPGTMASQEKGPGWSSPWNHTAIVKDSIWIWIEFSNLQTLPLKGDRSI